MRKALGRMHQVLLSHPSHAHEFTRFLESFWIRHGCNVPADMRFMAGIEYEFQLAEQGVCGTVEDATQSLIDALMVGATIEDLDIHDLDEALSRTDNDDIRTVYQNLQKGSRNPLRAFVGLLEDSGVPYEPQYISIEEYEQIVDTPRERGRLDADGNPLDCPANVGLRYRHHRHHRHND